MDVGKKVKTALSRAFKPVDLDIEDDDGIIGVVVSDRFRKVESIDRQTLVQHALRESLTAEEMRHVLVIAPMTPEEYVALDPARKSLGRYVEDHDVMESMPQRNGTGLS